MGWLPFSNPVMQRESKMLSKTTLGRMLQALLKRYALTTWRRCKQGTVDESFSVEDAGHSEAIQRNFWRKNTALDAADSTGVFQVGLPERTSVAPFPCNYTLVAQILPIYVTLLLSYRSLPNLRFGKKIQPI